MKKNIVLGIGMAIMALPASGQAKYLTNEGEISFYSHTRIEDIKADNNKVACVIDAASGDLAVIVVMTEFRFKKKLMQEHFNENYVESEKYPKATFNGAITNNAGVDYSSPGTTAVQVEGDLTIHGTTRSIVAEGTLEVTGTGVTARTTFMLNPEDYGIRIPNVVRNNIAESMEITVVLECSPI